MAIARAFISLTGTNFPNCPFLSISDGPEGQSVETIGVPHANASTITFPKPS